MFLERKVLQRLRETTRSDPQAGSPGVLGNRKGPTPGQEKKAKKGIRDGPGQRHKKRCNPRLEAKEKQKKKHCHGWNPEKGPWRKKDRKKHDTPRGKGLRLIPTSQRKSTLSHKEPKDKAISRRRDPQEKKLGEGSICINHLRERIYAHPCPSLL